MMPFPWVFAASSTAYSTSPYTVTVTVTDGTNSDTITPPADQTSIEGAVVKAVSQAIKPS